VKALMQLVQSRTQVISIPSADKRHREVGRGPTVETKAGVTSLVTGEDVWGKMKLWPLSYLTQIKRVLWALVRVIWDPHLPLTLSSF
jgi:hypothetical protein